ncbi:MAG: pyruvate dehydrogenase [Chloroflexi bacterium UTCFX4]|jgi:2-oxoisovalerate dehydrogenase E1 component|nr:MAG: pyruvate dehydrogenase [Chloroflexi bacterium UTCFX4]
MTHPFDWRAIARQVLRVRELDQFEEQELVAGKMTDPRRIIKYQFSAGGHELVQVLLANALDHPRDAAGIYYRSRPFLLSIGLTVREVLAGGLGRVGSPSEGRDAGVMFNLPARGRATALPCGGDIGAQYSPSAGWANAIRYRARVLGETEWEGAIAVAMGGDASAASNGFWAALNIATTQNLPLLFSIEDNQYGISVPAQLQTPGGNIAANLASYGNLKIFECDGAKPLEAAETIYDAVRYTRAHGTALARLRVPRLQGHTYGEDQRAYKSEALLEQERARDPVTHLREFVLQNGMTADEWDALRNDVRAEIRAAWQQAVELPEPDPAQVTRFILADSAVPIQGGLRPEAAQLANGSDTPQPKGTRLNMLDAIRKTLEHELRVNPRMLLFGEDVGPRGGVHRATVGLQKEFGVARVFDTSLNEEGIMGRALGLAWAGLLPVPEIQFRNYADPAQNELSDIGTTRWRTANKFANPMVVRMPAGITMKQFGALGDPWHSPTNEAPYAHMVGWRIAFPSNAQDAVGLLRAALRGDDPTIFIEHRGLLDTPNARRPYPGDDYCLPFGIAAQISAGDELTVITWGECVYRCLEAAQAWAGRVEILDLRTLIPWDREKILDSVKKTGKAMVVHEDLVTGGFGGEIIATLARDAFADLDAPLERVATADTPIPFNSGLLAAALPSVEKIRATMEKLLRF